MNSVNSSIQRRNWIIVLVICILALVGCFIVLGPFAYSFAVSKHKQQRLPSGSYLSPSGTERIVVEGSSIHYSILLPRSGSNLFERTYRDHSVWPSGHIQPFPMRSAEWMYGVGQFHWNWDGTNIIRSNRNSGEVTHFQLADR